MIRPGLRHGFDETSWNRAKAEARDIMAERAGRREPTPIAYSELVAKMQAIKLDAHDPRLAHLLGEIATEERLAGRGLLTVVVVHKSGDRMPGPGFFELAETLGYDVSDDLAFWSGEMRRVNEVWRREGGAHR